MKAWPHQEQTKGMSSEAWGTTLYTFWGAAVLGTRAELDFDDIINDVERWYSMSTRCRGIALGLLPCGVRRAALRPGFLGYGLGLLSLFVLLSGKFFFEGRNRVLLLLGGVRLSCHAQAVTAHRRPKSSWLPCCLSAWSTCRASRHSCG